MFDGYVKHKVRNNIGPRMTASGWMSYFRGICFWDELHNIRAFGIAAWAGGRGLFYAKFGLFNLPLEACEESVGAEKKKAPEKMVVEVKALKANEAKAMAQLYLQGWDLRRKIRLLKLATLSSERLFSLFAHGYPW